MDLGQLLLASDFLQGIHFHLLIPLSCPLAVWRCFPCLYFSNLSVSVLVGFFVCSLKFPQIFSILWVYDKLIFFFGPYPFKYDDDDHHHHYCLHFFQDSWDTGVDLLLWTHRFPKALSCLVFLLVFLLLLDGSYGSALQLTDFFPSALFCCWVQQLRFITVIFSHSEISPQVWVTCFFTETLRQVRSWSFLWLLPKWF